MFTPNDRDWEDFRGNFIIRSEFLPKDCWKEEVAERNIFYISFYLRDYWAGFWTHTFYSGPYFYIIIIFIAPISNLELLQIT